MEIELKKLLEGTLVVPYSDEEINRLSLVCDAVVNGNEFNDDKVSDLAIMVLTHTQNESLKDEFESVYESQNDETVSLPRSVCEALAAYAIYKAVEKDDITYQLALLNSMVVMNGRWEHLPFAELFAYCVEKSIAAVDGEAALGEEDDTELLKQIFDGQKLEGQSIDEGMLGKIKTIARDAWYHRTQKVLDGDAVKQHTTYSKVYVGLTNIVDSLPWTFLNQRALQQIHDLAPRTTTKELTVAEIVEQVKSLNDTERDLNSHSSILLHMMADDDFEGHQWTLSSTKMSVRAFAVYLYYELMLEKYFV